jgi:hypothetical protein
MAAGKITILCDQPFFSFCFITIIPNGTADGRLEE